MQRTVEAFVGRLPFVERRKPFIKTGKGRACYELPGIIRMTLTIGR